MSSASWEHSAMTVLADDAIPFEFPPSQQSSRFTLPYPTTQWIQWVPPRDPFAGDDGIPAGSPSASDVVVGGTGPISFGHPMRETLPAALGPIGRPMPLFEYLVDSAYSSPSYDLPSDDKAPGKMMVQRYLSSLPENGIPKGHCRHVFSDGRGGFQCQCTGFILNTSIMSPPGATCDCGHPSWSHISSAENSGVPDLDLTPKMGPTHVPSFPKEFSLDLKPEVLEKISCPYPESTTTSMFESDGTTLVGGDTASEMSARPRSPWSSASLASTATSFTPLADATLSSIPLSDMSLSCSAHSSRASTPGLNTTAARSRRRVQTLQKPVPPVPAVTRSAPVSSSPSTRTTSTSSKAESHTLCDIWSHRPQGDPRWFQGSMSKHKKTKHSMASNKIDDSWSAPIPPKMADMTFPQEIIPRVGRPLSLSALDTRPKRSSHSLPKKLCHGRGINNKPLAPITPIMEKPENSPAESSSTDLGSSEDDSCMSDTLSAIGQADNIPGVEEYLKKLLQAFQDWRAGNKRTFSEANTPATTSNGGDSQNTTGTSDNGISTNTNVNTTDSPDLQQGSSKKRKTMSTSNRTFACPFWKKDQRRHRACGKLRLTRVKDVKQHLNRSRAHKPHYCSCCFETFTSREALDEHNRARSCEVRSPQPVEGLTDEQIRFLQRRVDRRLGEEEQWFCMWDIVYPDTARPATPYVDHDLSEDLAEFREFITSEAAVGVFRRYLEEYGYQFAAPERGREVSNGIITAGLEVVYERWVTRRILGGEGGRLGDGDGAGGIGGDDEEGGGNDVVVMGRPRTSHGQGAIGVESQNTIISPPETVNSQGRSPELERGGGPFGVGGDGGQREAPQEPETASFLDGVAPLSPLQDMGDMHEFLDFDPNGQDFNGFMN